MSTLPPPQLVVQLAGQQQQQQQGPPIAASTGGAWLQLSPDTMHQHRLHSEQLVLVGLCAPVAAAAAATPGASPGAFTTPTRTSSSFGPAVPLLQPEDVQLVDHWRRAGCVPSIDTAAPQQQPGRVVLPVSLWPCAKLSRGAAVVSAAAWAGLMQPPPGSHLALYLLPPTTAGAPQPAAVLQLHMCLDPAQQHLLTPTHLQLADGSSSAGAAAPGAFSTPPRKTPTSGSKKGSKSSSKTPKQRGGSGGGTTSGAAAAAAAALTQWQLHLLQGGLDWSKPRQRQLLQQLIHRQLLGCCFLPGNLMHLPVLGVRVLFHLLPTAAAADEAAAAGASNEQTPSIAALQQLCPLLVGPSTQLQLQEPAVAGQQQQQDPSSISAAIAPASTLDRRLEAARTAAQQAVVGSSQEAAMAAAERAVRAGHAAMSSGSGYSRLGGVQAHSQALRELVLLPLQMPQLFARYKLRPPRGVLLHGPPGSGKTALARAAAIEAGAALLVVNGPDVLTAYYGESEAGLTGIFAAAAALSPSIILIDEVDAIAPSREAAGHGGASSHTAAVGGGGGAAGEAAARVLTQLLVLMDGLSSWSGTSSSSAGSSGGSSSSSGNRVVVIAATNRPAAVDPALRRPGRFERELEVGVPDPAAREDILNVKLASVRHDLSAAQIHQLASHTQGFVGADMAALVNEAALAALRRHVAALQQHEQQPPREPAQPPQKPLKQPAAEAASQLCVRWRDFEAARLLVRPSALRDVAVEVPQVSWDDVGGLADVKQRLQEAVLWPQQHADALARLGATAPKGVLLYGPPGCSKTLLARAVAASAGLNFLSVKGGELYSSYVGETERAVAALFARARGAAPAVVFFDELDGLVSVRDDTGSGIGERVLAQLLTELDGLQPRLGVVVLAATNRPDKVDPALLRPGRFDRLLLVPPPDAAARREIFRVHTRKTPLAADVDLDWLGGRTEGYTGADITAVCREAALAALDEALTAAHVAARHFELALLRVLPSSAPGSDVVAMYAQFQRHSGLQAL